MQKFINNWSTTITQPLSESDTVIHIDLDSANRLAEDFQQGDYYLLTLDDGVNVEVVKVKAINGSELTVNRGQENTAAKGWDFGAIIDMRITSGALNDFARINERILTINGEILVSPVGSVMQTY